MDFDFSVVNGSALTYTSTRSHPTTTPQNLTTKGLYRSPNLFFYLRFFLISKPEVLFRHNLEPFCRFGLSEPYIPVPNSGKIPRPKKLIFDKNAII